MHVRYLFFVKPFEATASVKDVEEESQLSLPACPSSYWQVHSFTGIKGSFSGIPAHTED